jgi:hypothetical protein
LVVCDDMAAVKGSRKGWRSTVLVMKVGGSNANNGLDETLVFLVVDL